MRCAVVIEKIQGKTYPSRTRIVRRRNRLLVTLNAFFVLLFKAIVIMHDGEKIVKNIDEINVAGVKIIPGLVFRNLGSE